jgi:hypothetical protein
MRARNKSVGNTEASCGGPYGARMGLLWWGHMGTLTVGPWPPYEPPYICIYIRDVLAESPTAKTPLARHEVPPKAAPMLHSVFDKKKIEDTLEELHRANASVTPAFAPAPDVLKRNNTRYIHIYIYKLDLYMYIYIYIFLRGPMGPPSGFPYGPTIGGPFGPQRAHHKRPQSCPWTCFGAHTYIYIYIYIYILRCMCINIYINIKINK